MGYRAVSDARTIFVHELALGDTILAIDSLTTGDSHHLHVMSDPDEASVSGLFEFITPFGVVGMWGDNLVQVIRTE